MFRFFGWPGVGKATSESAKDRREELQLQIRNFLQGVDRKHKFLPAGRICQLVTRKSVCAVMPPQIPPALVDFICRDAKKIFLALVYGGRADPAELMHIMTSIQQHGMTDDRLPVDVECMGCGGSSLCFARHDRPLDAFHDTKWGRTMISHSFQSDQHMFNAPIFNKSKFVYELDGECILPFTERGGREKDGHFSTVSEAVLHTDHEDFTQRQGNQRQSIHVALKKLKHLDSEKEYNIERAWEHEVSALQEISELKHPNLIQPLAAIKHGTERYIMFEWADGGSLRDVWLQQGPEPSVLSKDRVMCVLEELKGLAGALAALHNTNNDTKTARITSSASVFGTTDYSPITVQINGSTTVKSSLIRSSPIGPREVSSRTLQVPRIQIDRDGSEDDTGSAYTGTSSELEGSYASEDLGDAEVHWRHGDLKPDNILQFKDKATGDRSSSRWLGKLKIADLGLAKQHMLKTSRRNEQTQQKYTTSQYEAPEAMANTHAPRSRRYDIWSMGCVILEFVIILLYGNRGLEAFYSERPHSSSSTETLYFTVDKRRGITEVSHIVDHWMKQILKDPECDRQSGSAIGDLVKLVKERLLVVDLPQDGMSRDELSRCRADARELQYQLEFIWKTARDDEEQGGNYLCDKQTRSRERIPLPTRSDKTRAKPTVRFLGDNLQPKRRDQV